MEPLLLLCWQLRIFEFLCDMPGSALYVCCECDHNLGDVCGCEKSHIVMSTQKFLEFRTERVECCSVGMYDGRLQSSMLHTLCVADYIT